MIPHRVDEHGIIRRIRNGIGLIFGRRIQQVKHGQAGIPQLVEPNICKSQQPVGCNHVIAGKLVSRETLIGKLEGLVVPSIDVGSASLFQQLVAAAELLGDGRPKAR